ncbi:MAG TPA: polysaccharide ABC transporter ATP-binding protein [Deltaproteobacteria bacterium]|nr:polysaccharide ABC transporter ATP-binding protein [Deltaproteobacteria bacterium]HPR53738.1 polysaccharide ABC transporter ATP-binding protein [Deltaproteobacteria bacterium]HXK46755.1 polysaccharide ABC transporter ATP-binding protein [Deltaproteobacteria bacterium]
MSEELLISVDLVSKKFCRYLKKSLWYGVQDIFAEILCRDNGGRRLRSGEFWALQDVSVEVKRGEMLGLIGQNGAGKSTLLKMLNGLMKPDMGTISIAGNVQALIELGAGFNPVLTGRENIYINAAVLGISKRKIDKALPDIIDFAGLEDFIDTPVASYSSGMKARLGFSIATQLDPDVLLIDEVLAVGDMAFQEKCMRRMDALRNSDKAIVFVTHSLYQVEALCNKALWLDKGSVVQYGDAGEVVRAYLDNQERRAMEESRREGIDYQGRVTEATRAYLTSRDNRSTAQKTIRDGHSVDLVDITKVELVDSTGEVRDEFPFYSDFLVRIYYNASKPVFRPLFNLRFLHNGRGVFEVSMLIDGHGPEWVEGAGMVECTIPSIPLTPKLYDILLFVRSGDGIADISTMRTVANFRITDDHLDKIPLVGPMAMNHIRQGSPVYLPRTWRFYSGKTLIQTVESRYHEPE